MSENQRVDSLVDHTVVEEGSVVEDRPGEVAIPVVAHQPGEVARQLEQVARQLEQVAEQLKEVATKLEGVAQQLVGPGKQSAGLPGGAVEPKTERNRHKKFYWRTLFCIPAKVT
jgi:hypothetical protein